MKKIRESDLYSVVEKWLTENHLCFKTDKNKGLRKYSIIDVIGVTDVGGDLSGEVETIAVEVKRGNQPFAKASGQALAYKIYANRIYLADLRDNHFSPDEIYIASHIGIGLIQIQDHECTEVLSSPYYKPIEKLNLMLLENLALGKCQLCGCFFGIGDIEQNKFTKLAREKFGKAMKDGKGLMFWNREVNERKLKSGIETRDSKFTHETRFICPDCISYFFSQFKLED